MLKFDTETTICAVATGPIGAPRGAIRITGPDAITVAKRVFGDFNPPRHPRRIPGSIALERLGEIDVALFVWPDFKSYTGQPSVEIHCLGAPIVLQMIQRKLLDAGASLAQPGEFTLRAFLAGKLDLTQCEAVLGVIHATNERSLNIALKQLSGGLATPLKTVRTILITLLADIEAGLDFVDEDISFISNTEVQNRLTEANELVSQILKQISSRAGQQHHFQVVIAGPPNAGKSSLLNALAHDSLAIVSPEPGTTRDFVRCRMEIDGIPFDLLDTAGLESIDDDGPRGLAQSFTQEQLDQADLILLCHSCEDLSALHQSDLQEDPSTSHNSETWRIITKRDLLDKVSRKPIVAPHHFSISTMTGDGLESLKLAIQLWLSKKNKQLVDAMPMTAERCYDALQNATQALGEALRANEYAAGEEIVAGEIRLALDELGQVAGVVYTDDILDVLFSRFCIGK
jgi:tRNA modification GTPase